jgi:hypothetical protein
MNYNLLNIVATVSVVAWLTACSTKSAQEEDSDSGATLLNSDNGGDGDGDADSDSDSDSDIDTDADGDKFVGNITTMGRIRSDFLQYWDQITPETEG